MIKKSFIPVLVLFCCIAASSAQAQQAAQAPGKVSIKLKGVDGKNYDLSEMRGQVLLVSFGATWCRPCDAELLALEELKREFKSQPVRFLWVSIERDEEISDGKLRDYVKAKGLTFPVLRDTTGDIYRQFSVRRRIPLVIFINQEGELALPQHTGMAEPELYKRTMRERINKLLQTTAPVVSTVAQ